MEQDACAAAEHVQGEFPAKRDGLASGGKFELFGVSVLSEVTDGCYELDGGRGKELSKSVQVILLALASAAFFSRRSSATEASQTSSLAKTKVLFLTVVVLETGPR